MAMYTFIGAGNVGKSHTALAVAKILSRMGKNALIIDATSNQGILSAFNFDDDAKNQEDKAFSFTREDIDFLIPNQKTDPLKGVLVNEYDYIFLETDRYLQLIEQSECIFFVSNCDKRTFAKMESLFSQIKGVDKITFIFNGLMEGKNYKNYIYNILLSNASYSAYLAVSNDIEIPFSENDIMLSFAAKIDGSFKLRSYSSDFKDALFKIVNLITQLNEKDYKKTLRKRSAKKC